MGELNRDVLINHLFDIRALEFAKINMEKTLNEDNDKIKRLGYAQHYYKPSFAGVIIVPLLVAAILSYISYFLSQTLLKDVLFERYLDPKYYEMDISSSYKSAFYEYTPLYPEWNRYVLLCVIIILIVVAIIFFALLHSYITSKKEYNKKIKDDYERVKKEKQEIVRLKGEIDDVATKLKEANTLLSETYSINIIPRQFRTVQGVCYLYDYMSTSQQSLESAFLNYNINEINVSVNKVIEQQSEMILQQYVTNAKLDVVAGHSRKMMEQLANIEKNSALTAQYSAITAANAKSIAFFEGYKYYKNK